MTPASEIDEQNEAIAKAAAAARAAKLAEEKRLREEKVAAAKAEVRSVPNAWILTQCYVCMVLMFTHFFVVVCARDVD